MVLQKYDLGKKRRRGLGAWISQHCLSGLTYPFASVDTAKAHASAMRRVSRQPSFLQMSYGVVNSRDNQENWRSAGAKIVQIGWNTKYFPFYLMAGLQISLLCRYWCSGKHVVCYLFHCSNVFVKTLQIYRFSQYHPNFFGSILQTNVLCEKLAEYCLSAS